MHCQDCQDLLLDLAYGELDEARAVEVRAHIDDCDACSAEWARLQRGRGAAAMLPVVSAPAPSRALLDAIDKAIAKPAVSASGTSNPSVQAQPDRSGARAVKAPDTSARVAASGGASGATTADKSEAERAEGATVPAGAEGSNVVPLRGGARWIERIAALAMRREVAMAAVFLMALGVGVTTLYNPSRNPAIAEEERARDVIPAVEVNNAPSGERNEARRAATDPARARLGERPAERTRPTVASPQPAQTANGASAALLSGRRVGVADDSRPSPASENTAPSLDDSPVAQQRSQRTQSESPSNVEAQQAMAAPPSANNLRVMPTAMSNAGVEVAGVQRQATSPAELSARAALDRGDTSAALQQYRLALASASDDLTRARIQRQITTLEEQQAASNAAEVQAAASASTQQTQSQSYRRARAQPARATNRARTGAQNASDHFNNMGF